MKPFIFIKYGENLRESFNEQVAEAENIILSNTSEILDKTQIRFSEKIGATINFEYFTVEYIIWEYSIKGKPFAFLNTLFDTDGKYFEISA